MFNLSDFKTKYDIKIEPIMFNLPDLEIKQDFLLAKLQSDAIERYARFQSEREAGPHYILNMHDMPNIVSDLLRESHLNRSVYNWNDNVSDSYHQSNELHELAKSTEVSDLNKMEEILKLKKEFFIKKASAFTNVLMMNAPDRTDNTPLHIAILNQNLPVIKLLLAYGAGLFFENNDGYTPLHCAVQGGHKEIVEILLDKGADINAKDGQGRTPLHRAVEKGNTDAIKALIQKTLIQNSSAQKPDYLAGASSTYWDGCKNEIEGKKIGSSNISYLDLLKASKNEIVKYVKNRKIRDILNDLDYEEFPIFGSQIKNKFHEGIERRDLINNGKKVIECFDCGSNIKLNSEVSEEIAFYLLNSDLKSLKDIGDNNENAHVKPSTKMDEAREEQGITGNGRKV